MGEEIVVAEPRHEIIPFEEKVDRILSAGKVMSEKLNRSKEDARVELEEMLVELELMEDNGIVSFSEQTRAIMFDGIQKTYHHFDKKFRIFMTCMICLALVGLLVGLSPSDASWIHFVLVSVIGSITPFVVVRVLESYLRTKRGINKNLVYYWPNCPGLWSVLRTKEIPLHERKDAIKMYLRAGWSKIKELEESTNELSLRSQNP